MKGDASFIFKASRMASATTDFLLAFVREPEARRGGARLGHAPLAKAERACFDREPPEFCCTSSGHHPQLQESKHGVHATTGAVRRVDRS